MEMHQIRYFLAVARTLNFTRAAEECNVAQPSLTRAIKNLEAELGGEMFRRERASSHLTELGRAMLPFLTHSYDSALAAKSQAESLKKGDTAVIRVALSRTVDFDVVSDALCEMEHAFDSFQFSCERVSADVIVDQLRSGDAEIVIAGPITDGWDRLDEWPLFDESYQVALRKNHALAGKVVFDVDDLSNERVITRPYCEQWQECWTMLEKYGVENAQCYEVANDHDAIRLLEAGLGIVLLPSSVRIGENLRKIPLADTFERTIRIYAVAGRRRSQALSGFMNLLRSADWTRYENPVSNG